MNLNLVSWDYPQNNGLKDWIDGSGLHPVTCLTTLTQKEKQMLLDKKIVLCKTIHHNHSALQSIGIKSPRLEKVMEECEALCNEFTLS
jgi:mevalonate kinase